MSLQSRYVAGKEVELQEGDSVPSNSSPGRILNLFCVVSEAETPRERGVCARYPRPLTTEA